MPLDGEYFDDTVGNVPATPTDTISGNDPPVGPEARACRCTWSRRGARAAGSIRRCSTTPRSGMFLEKRFGIRVDAISPWHRAVCGDLTSAFDFAHPNDPAVPGTARHEQLGRVGRARSARCRHRRRRPRRSRCSRKTACATPAPCPTYCTPPRKSTPTGDRQAPVRQHRQRRCRVPCLRQAAPGPDSAALHGGGRPDPGRRLDGRRRRHLRSVGARPRTASTATSRATSAR